MLLEKRNPTLCDYSWSVLRDRTAYTPDWTELNHSKQSKFLVFITGNCRKGRKGNILLNGCDYFGTGITVGSNFMLKRPVESNPEPILLELPPNRGDKLWNHIYMIPSHMNHIEGDVYSVPPSIIAELDEYEENTVGIKRMKRYVRMVDQPKLFRSEQMFMWITDTNDYLNFIKENRAPVSCTIRSRIIDGEEFKGYSY